MRAEDLPLVTLRTPATAALSVSPCFAPHSPELQVGFGQATFDAEGQEAQGKLFSRAIHWPGGSSGVTIGRGYDMGQRTPLQVIRELAIAGVPAGEARILSGSAGLRGEAAKRFYDQHHETSPIISLEAQKRLFELVTIPETVSDIKRILGKLDLVGAYGRTSWEELSPQVKAILVDLRYRGDYTPTTRKVIQPLITAGDTDGLAAVMRDESYWRGLGVPSDRIKRRAEMFTPEVSEQPLRSCA